eukprot:1401412-Rhodomonas_salina.1
MLCSLPVSAHRQQDRLPHPSPRSLALSLSRSLAPSLPRSLAPSLPYSLAPSLPRSLAPTQPYPASGEKEQRAYSGIHPDGTQPGSLNQLPK